MKIKKYKLTEKTYFKKTWLGLVLMVEIIYDDPNPCGVSHFNIIKWKKASELDLQELRELDKMI